MRTLYKKSIENEQILVEVELDAVEHKERYGWLFSVFVKFDYINSDEKAFEEFLETKENLIITLEFDNNAKYLGMKSIEGWCELYFCAKNSKGFASLAGKSLSGSGYLYESNVVKDTKWDVYETQLFPNELEFCNIQSAQIIAELQEEGDNLQSEREVEHYVVFDTLTQKERFLEKILAHGFEYKDDISTEEFEHGVALTKVHSLIPEIVDTIVQEIFEIVKKDHGYYEGWSTVLVME